MKPPINWIPPEGFNEHAPGIGAPSLEGVSHNVIYDPKPSAANVDEGGDGHYESLFHGTYCHGPTLYRQDNWLVVTWSNHTRDEGGPGQRRLGTVARIEGDEILFEGKESYFELIPQCAPTYRRQWVHDGKLLHPYAGGELSIINGSFYVQSHIAAVPGYTIDEKYRHYYGVLPEDAYSEKLDEKMGFVFDMWVDLGGHFIQSWNLFDGKFLPDSPMYKQADYIDRYEITEGRFLSADPLLDPFTSAESFESASDEMKDDLLEGTPEPGRRVPTYRPGTSPIAADGINALAHTAEFRRTDGRWVVLRDNLLNKGNFYAAVKDTEADFYEPAVETNMLGGANPEAGELPDGRVYIIYNTFDDHINDLARCRKDMMIAVSKDGITFDRTWLVLRVDVEPDGGIYKMGGPQYFNSMILGENLWVFYSITKEKIGVTRIPIGSLG